MNDKYPGFNGMEVVTKETVIQSGRMAVPGLCIFTLDGEGPFLDTGTIINAKDLNGVDPYALISVAKVRDMGRAIGMVPREEIEELKAQLDEYAAKLEDLQRLADALIAREAADRVLEGAIG